jgi:hypothetical protein
MDVCFRAMAQPWFHAAGDMMRPKRARLFGLAWLLLVYPHVGGAWQTNVGEVPPALVASATALAVADDGTLFAAGGGRDFLTTRFTVVSLAPSTGEVLWTFDGGIGTANAVAVDAAGDVVAVGVTGTLGAPMRGQP